MGASQNAGHVTSNIGGSPIIKPKVTELDRSLAQPLPDARKVEPVAEETKATAEEIEARKKAALAENTTNPEEGDVDIHISTTVEEKKDENEEEDGEEQEEK